MGESGKATYLDVAESSSFFTCSADSIAPSVLVQKDLVQGTAQSGRWRCTPAFKVFNLEITLASGQEVLEQCGFGDDDLLLAIPVKGRLRLD